MSEFHRLECDCERCDLLHAAYDEGVQDSMLRAEQYKRILADLIAELRAAHHPMADLDGEPRLCVQGCGILPCHSLSAAASAEQRLREVQGE